MSDTENLSKSPMKQLKCPLCDKGTLVIRKVRLAGNECEMADCPEHNCRALIHGETIEDAIRKIEEERRDNERP